MGFLLERRDMVITFGEAHEYHGAEIKGRLDADVKTFLTLQAINDNSGSAELESAFTMFGDQIIQEWNIENEDGTTVPATGEGFLSLPPAFCLAVITEWANVAGSAGKD